MTRECKRCKKNLPISDFGKNRREKDGTHRQCRKCNTEVAMLRYNKRVERKRRPRGLGAKRRPGGRALESRIARMRKYGLTLEDYDSLLEAQSRVCKICGKEHTKGKPLVVDHCHKTGLVRGLLCGPCNSGLGFMRDNEDLLLSAIKYLQQTKARSLT